MRVVNQTYCSRRLPLRVRSRSQDASSAPEYDDGSEKAEAIPIEGGISLEMAATAILKHARGDARVLVRAARAGLGSCTNYLRRKLRDARLMHYSCLSGPHSQEIEARDLSALCGFEDLARSQRFDGSIAVAFSNHVRSPRPCTAPQHAAFRSAKR